MKTMYAILDVPNEHDFANDISDHHIFESGERDIIAAKLIRMSAADDINCVEEYNAYDDGEFCGCSRYYTPSNFIKQMDTDSSRIYSLCVREAFNYTEQDAYISDTALSSVWADRDEIIPESRINWLRSIWTAAHRTVKDICKDAGYTQRGLARHFLIPVRTVENWCMGVRTCPAYLSMLIQESLGLVSRRYWL